MILQLLIFVFVVSAFDQKVSILATPLPDGTVPQSTSNGIKVTVSDLAKIQLLPGCTQQFWELQPTILTLPDGNTFTINPGYVRRVACIEQIS